MLAYSYPASFCIITLRYLVLLRSPLDYEEEEDHWQKFKVPCPRLELDPNCKVGPESECDLLCFLVLHVAIFKLSAHPRIDWITCSVLVLSVQNGKDCSFWKFYLVSSHGVVDGFENVLKIVKEPQKFQTFSVFFRHTDSWRDNMQNQGSIQLTKTFYFPKALWLNKQSHLSYVTQTWGMMVVWALSWQNILFVISVKVLHSLQHGDETGKPRVTALFTVSLFTGSEEPNNRKKSAETKLVKCLLRKIFR